MNIRSTKEFLEGEDVAVLRADIGTKSPAILAEMERLGNPLGMIPFYAIYSPTLKEPITFNGPITSGKIINAIKEAKPSGASE